MKHTNQNSNQNYETKHAFKDAFLDTFSFNVKTNYKTIMLLAFLVFLPNLLSMINITTPYGFKLHFFQLGIFVAAMLYGPLGGLLSGAIGSAYSAMIMHNPYIILFNVILGFGLGYFFKKGFKPIVALLLSFAIELPVLFAADYYLMHMPIAVLVPLMISLAITNLIWLYIADYSSRKIKHALAH